MKIEQNWANKKQQCVTNSPHCECEREEEKERVCERGKNGRMFVWTLTRSIVSCSHYALTLYIVPASFVSCVPFSFSVLPFYFAHLFIVRDVCLEDDFALLQYILWFNVVVRQTLMCYCRWFHHIVGNLPILSWLHRNIHMCNICGECVLCRKPKEKKTFRFDKNYGLFFMNGGDVMRLPNE